MRLKQKKLVLGIRNITLKLADNDRMEFNLVKVMEMGTWYEVKFGIFFSSTHNGFVKVWINQEK